LPHAGAGAPSAFAKSVAETIRRHDMIRAGDAIVVGVSGGADSVALLCALNELAPLWGLRLTVAHLHHGIRGTEADADAEFVRTLAADLRLPCVADRVDVPAIVRAEGGSIEDAARRERYAFLGRVAASTGAGVIALGHTSDDNAETVIHRILRGTGIRGLGGIPPVRPLARGSTVRVVRPLIESFRREIIADLESIGRTFRTDSTNLDRAYLRNRLRLDLLPLLERDYAPDVKESLNRLAASARNQYNVIEHLARELAARAVRQEAGLVLDRAVLRAANPELQVEAARLALEDAGVPELSYEQSRELLDVISAETGREMSLPGGCLLRAEYGVLRLVSPRAAMREAPGEVELPVPGRAEFLGRAFSASIVEMRAGAAPAGLLDDFRARKTEREELIDFHSLSLPLTIRTRRPGDRFHPLGSRGSCKLQDFFVDAKIPAWQRDRVPIVCDRAGIVWVAGWRIDHRVRITDATRSAVLLEMANP